MERPDLAHELQRLADNDLLVRQRLLDAGELYGGYHPTMRAVHRRNGDRLWEVLDEVDRWPGFLLIGENGSDAAYLIAQHDIANPALLRRSLELYHGAVEEADAEPSKLANMEDRICYFEGRPQRYGTQVGWNEDGEFGPWPPVEDLESVDQRRALLGLDTLAEAIAAAAAHRRVRPSAAQLPSDRKQFDEFARQAGWRSKDA